MVVVLAVYIIGISSKGRIIVIILLVVVNDHVIVVVIIIIVGAVVIIIIGMHRIGGFVRGGLN